MYLSLVTAPAALAVPLATVKAHCRVEIDDDDSYITTLIKVATTMLQDRTRRQFIHATWRVTLDAFPSEIKLPLAPVSSVSSLKYFDADDVQQTLNASLYQFQAGEPPRIVPAIGESWPDISSRIGAVEVNFVAGYGAGDTAVPDDLKQAIQWLVAQWYEWRLAAEEAQLREMPFGVEAIVWANRWCL